MRCGLYSTHILHDISVCVVDHNPLTAYYKCLSLILPTFFVVDCDVCNTLPPAMTTNNQTAYMVNSLMSAVDRSPECHTLPGEQSSNRVGEMKNILLSSLFGSAHLNNCPAGQSNPRY